MKKLLFVLMLTLILLLSVCSFNCFAEEASGSAETSERVIDVEALYKSEIKGLLRCKVESGSATVTTSDGTVISVSGVTGESLCLNILPITKNTDGYNWFQEQMEKKGTDLLVFNLFFTDESGNNVSPTESMTVTLSLTDGYNVPVICCVAQDGSVTTLETTVADGKIGFITNRNSFYVLAEAVPERTLIWIVSLIVTVSVIATVVFFFIKHKKRKALQ